jgi:hypothetical protein
MMRPVGTLATLLSVLWFPWQLTAFLALGMAFFEPLVPFAAGLFADTLYYMPHAGSFPIFTLAGALVTGVSFFVRSRLKTSSMRG